MQITSNNSYLCWKYFKCALFWNYRMKKPQFQTVILSRRKFHQSRQLVNKYQNHTFEMYVTKVEIFNKLLKCIITDFKSLHGIHHTKITKSYLTSINQVVLWMLITKKRLPNFNLVWSQNLEWLKLKSNASDLLSFYITFRNRIGYYEIHQITAFNLNI